MASPAALDGFYTEIGKVGNRNPFTVGEYLEVLEYIYNRPKPFFQDYAHKASPVSADKILINDSADADAIKYIEVGDLPSGGGGVNTANSPNANEFARFTDATHIEGRTVAEAKADLSLDNVTNESKATMFTNAALTGAPTAPTAVTTTNTTQIANTAFVQQELTARITALIGTAPSVLDTLGEISDAINDDANLYTTLTSAIAGKQASDAELTAIAGLVSAADKVPYFTGSGTAALADFGSVARTLLAQTTQANMRSTGLGLGTIATQDSNAVNITGGIVEPFFDGFSIPVESAGGKLNIIIGDSLTAPRILTIELNDSNKQLTLDTDFNTDFTPAKKILSASRTLQTNYCLYISDSLEVGSGVILTIASGAVLEVG